MTVRFLRRSRALRLVSALLSALLLLPSAATFAQPKAARHATQALPNQKPISALRVGDIISVRSIQTGKVELKRVTFAGKHTYHYLLSVQTICKGKQQALTCPPDQQFRLKSGRMVPAARLAVGNCIVTRAGPATVKALAQLRKPGGFVTCDVRVGPVPAARLPLLRTSHNLPVQFADYHQPSSALYADYVQPFTESMATGTPNPFLFAGQQYDPATGLYYLRARYYAPTTGRFLSQDPFAGDDADPATLHRYLYASNDPVNSVDPGGQSDFTVGGLEGGLGAGAPVDNIEAQEGQVGARIIGQINGTIPTANPASIGGATALQRIIALGLAGTIALGAVAPAFTGIGPPGGAAGDATGNNDPVVWLVHGTTKDVAETLLVSPPLLNPPGYEDTPLDGFHTALASREGILYAKEYAKDAARSSMRQNEGGPMLLFIGVPIEVYSAASVSNTQSKSGLLVNEYNFLIYGPKSYGFDTLVQNWADCQKYTVPVGSSGL